MDEVLDELVGCLDHPVLPLLQWKEELSFVESRLPAGVCVCLCAASHSCAAVSCLHVRPHVYYLHRACQVDIKPLLRCDALLQLTVHTLIPPTLFACQVLPADWSRPPLSTRLP